MKSSLVIFNCRWTALAFLLFAGCADWDDYRVGAGGAGGAGDAASTSGVGGGSGPEAVPTRCGGVSLLADNFEASEGMGALWQPSGAALVEGGEVVIKPPSSVSMGTWNVYTSRHFYDLRGDAVSIEAKSMLNQASDAYAAFKIAYDDDNYLEMTQSHGKLRCAKAVAGQWTSIGETPYDAQAQRLWRLREESGTLYCETSGDGASWTMHGSSSSVFEVSSIRVEFGVSVDPDQGDPGEVRFDNLKGELPAGQRCKASSLKDDFEDAMIGHGWARSYFDPACEHTEVNGKLSFTLPAGTAGACNYRSSSAFDLTADTLAIEVPLPPDPATEGEAFFSALIAGQTDQLLQFHLYAGHLFFREILGETTRVINDLPYDPNEHRFWRLREEAGQTFWETSADGQAWKTRAQAPDPFPVTALDIEVSAYRWQESPSPVVVHFDNVNTPQGSAP